MKYQWSQFPFVLRRKILLTFLAGIASIAVSFVIFTVAADRILLVLGGLIFAASLVLGSSLWRTAARGQYEVVEGVCASVITPMLRRYRKIQLIDEQGAERTLLLSKTASSRSAPATAFIFKKGVGLPSETTIWTLPSPPIVSLDMRCWRIQFPLMER